MSAVNRLSGNRVSRAILRPVLAAIKLRYGMQALEPVVQDGKWAVHGVVNPDKTEKTDKGDDGDAGNDPFPYEIGEPVSGHVAVTPVGDAVRRLDAPVQTPMQGNDPMTGFVVNIATAPKDVKANVASRYLDEAWAGSPARAMAPARTAVVIGVNTMERLNPSATGQAEVAQAMGTIAAPQNLLMAAFGFLWTPTWYAKGTMQTVPIGDVRAAYQKLTSDEKPKAEAREKEVADKGGLPYGIFRETVLNSPYTHDAVGILKQVNQQVYILSQDADTGVVTLRLGGILAAYDKVLRDMTEYPLLVIGGYHYYGIDWGPNADVRTRQLTRLANQLDPAVRAAIEKAYGKILDGPMQYPTEPNMLIRAWDADAQGIFQNPQVLAMLNAGSGQLYGVGRTEGRTLRQNLRTAYGGSFSTPYDPRASVGTSPRTDDRNRHLAVTPDDVRQAVADGGQPVDAILRQAQSAANAERLAREFVQADSPPLKHMQQALRDFVFERFTDIARLLADNPRLTFTSPEVQAVRDQLTADVGRLTRRMSGDAAKRKEAYDRAASVMTEIISAMTAPDFQTFWERLKTELGRVATQSQPDDGASQ